MKFFAAVRPEEEILLRAEKQGQVDRLWQFQVSASVRGEVVAQGQLVLSLEEAKSSPELE